ncbi:PREDICTED: ataxin-2 homolog [Bactrocera latifrons]|uniref:ataxin-2 homolog n=1 Tax=Bactrocera latifrons TaxID=174628 RepID=UPI0008DC62AF|nr:PREDICTED: ataxin-2 homolog [Bactrocera latifrons]
MHDLCITIVEEHTKRVCRNFALTHTRRRTITIEEEEDEEAPTRQQQQQQHQQRQQRQQKAQSLPPISKLNAKTTTTTTTTTTKGPTTTTNKRTTREYVLPCSTPSESTSVTVAVPTNSSIKVWAEEDKDQSLLLHITKQRGDKAGERAQHRSI